MKPITPHQLKSSNTELFHSLIFILFTFQQGPVQVTQFPGHPDAVNSILSVVITGCEDGNVRAVHLYPQRFLGVVGHHKGELPIEKMDVSGSGEVIASISQDNR